jgi:small subunit ribosomal protein S6
MMTAAIPLRTTTSPALPGASASGRASELIGARVRRRKMRRYEAMVIVDPRLEEGDIQKAVDRFVGLVDENGGRVANVDRWGVRRFAYEINHQRDGYYFITTFTAPEESIERLKRTLQISDEFIRGKIVRPE